MTRGSGGMGLLAASSSSVIWASHWPATHLAMQLPECSSEHLVVSIRSDSGDQPKRYQDVAAETLVTAVRPCTGNPPREEQRGLDGDVPWLVYKRTIVLPVVPRGWCAAPASWGEVGGEPLGWNPQRVRGVSPNARCASRCLVPVWKVDRRPCEGQRDVVAAFWLLNSTARRGWRDLAVT